MRIIESILVAELFFVTASMPFAIAAGVIKPSHKNVFILQLHVLLLIGYFFIDQFNIAEHISIKLLMGAMIITVIVLIILSISQFIKGKSFIKN